MSSILTAISYIDDSGMNYWEPGKVTVLKDIIQNIWDGCYNDPSKICLDILNFTNPKNPPLWVIIKWMSLWDGKKEIFNSWDIEDCITGIQGRIRIIIEVCGETSFIELNDIDHIIFGDNIKPSHLIDLTANMIDTLGSSPISSPVISQDTHISH